MKGAFTPITTSDAPPTPPLGWSWRLLSDVARLESGHTPSRRVPEYWDNGTIPWLSLKDMRGLAGRYITDTVDKTTQAGIDNSSARILPAGTVAFCRTASVGDVVVLGRAMATSQDFANWVCGPALVPEYLYEALRASESEFDREKQGSTHKTIYMPVLERFRILLPPVDEQQRIADILDKADAIRRKRKEAIALTDDLLRSTFLEMFGDPVNNPKGWDVEPLGQLADIASGVTKGKIYGDQALVTVPYMRVANVQDGHIALDDVKTIAVSKTEAQRYQLAKGDVLLTEGGDPDKLGRGAVWHGEIESCIHQNHIFRVRPGHRVRPEYLSSIIASDRGKRYFMRAAKQTTGIASINMTQLKSFPCLCPPIELQDSYARFVARVVATQSVVRHRAESIADLFSALMASAFSQQRPGGLGC